MWWWHDFPMPWMMAWPSGFFIICIVMMALMMRHSGNGRRRQDPLDILKERFARGEIDQQEYENCKRFLSQS